MSPILDQFLADNPDLDAAFGQIPVAAREKYVAWIESAKTDETRRRRVYRSIRLIIDWHKE